MQRLLELAARRTVAHLTRAARRQIARRLARIAREVAAVRRALARIR